MYSIWGRRAGGPYRRGRGPASLHFQSRPGDSQSTGGLIEKPKTCHVGLPFLSWRHHTLRCGAQRHHSSSSHPVAHRWHHTPGPWKKRSPGQQALEVSGAPRGSAADAPVPKGGARDGLGGVLMAPTRWGHPWVGQGGPEGRGRRGRHWLPRAGPRATLSLNQLPPLPPPSPTHRP